MTKLNEPSTTKGILYIVATPIGNKEDITLRAIKILLAVDIILCEDTRKTYRLLATPGVAISSNTGTTRKIPRLESLFEGNEKQKINEVLTWLQQGKQVALVSNGGTPLISDPGYKLVRECIRQNIAITSLPGACAAITGLTLSGLPPDKFLFLGFLPKKKSKRDKIFKEIESIKKELNPTIIIYESPYRLIKTLVYLEQIFGDIQISISRELTKKFEEVKRNNINQYIADYNDKKLKGEFIIYF